MAETVVLGLSGGVDSAVAALRLRQAGYEVAALYLDVGLGGEEAAAENARRLDLEFHVAHVADQLERHVCQPFYEAYLAGRTPIPCAQCNPTVKFPALLRLADQLGARYVATGHYARVGRGQDGKAVLLRGPEANDQSYLLSRLTRDTLERVLFPLGDTPKAGVRREAEQAGLPSAKKPDSMEICFIPDQDYPAWLDRRGGTPPPGNFVDRAGNVLGVHKGYHHYTIGQRRGLGVSSSARLFVTAIRPETNEVVLSHGEGLTADLVTCGQLNWLGDFPLEGPLRVQARLRHSRTAQDALLIPLENGRAQLRMERPARAPTPGQLAAFYRGEQVLGSAWILSAQEVNEEDVRS